MRKLAKFVLTATLGFGCGRSPTPLHPAFAGSIGLPHHGVLSQSTELPKKGVGYTFLRDNERHFATARFARVLLRAAQHVETERPGGTLVLGDLSTAKGGVLLPHLSHRTGRDADLIFYATTLAGAAVAAPDFLHYQSDGLAWDPKAKRHLRLDVEREWLLLKALLMDPEGHIQWLFINNTVKTQLLAWGRARGEAPELLFRADEVMFEPHPGGAHDDHVHVRTACTSEERAAGCEHSGPERPWLGSGGLMLAWERPTDAAEIAEATLELLGGRGPTALARQP